MMPKKSPILLKVSLVLGFIITLLVLGLSLVSFELMSRRFQEWEDKDTLSLVQRAVNDLNKSRQKIAATVRDWASWDDTYAFIEDHNPRYIEENLSDTSFINLGVDFMLFFNTQNELIHQRSLPISGISALSDAQHVIKAISNCETLMLHRHQNPQMELSGFFVPELGQPLLLAAAAISRSNFAGPVRGTLITGRYLDHAMIRSLNNAGQMSMRIHPLGQMETLLDAQSMQQYIRTFKTPFVHILSPYTIVGYSALQDIEGKDAIMLEVIKNRDLYRQGLAIWRQHFLTALLFGCIMLLVLLFSLHRLVLRRIIVLTHQINAIALNDSSGMMVEDSGSDEISYLGKRINTMLQAQGHYQALQNDHEQYLKQLIDSINCGVMVIDAENRIILDMNKSGADLVGLPVQAIIGKECHQFVCPREQHSCPVLDCGEEVDLSERLILRADGGTTPVLKSVTSVYRAGKRLLIESFLDISGLKKIEMELKQSELKYRRFFEESLTGNFISLPNGSLIDCNPALAQMLGYETVEALKEVALEKHYFHPEERQAFLQLLRHKKRLEHMEWAVRHKSGKPVYCIANIVGVFDQQGQLKELRGYVFDNTKGSLLERQKRQSHKLEALTDFASGVTHDFNNILTGMVGYAELMGAKQYNLSPTQLSAYVEKILAAGEQGRSLMRRILARPISHESEQAITVLYDAVEKALAKLQSIQVAAIQVQTQLHSRATIHASPEHIEELLTNLLTHSMHAMMLNGGLLAVKLEEITLLHPLASYGRQIAAGQYLRLQIIDNAPGFEEHNLDRIFDPFFSRKKGDAGLCLWVVYNLISALHGLITVESTPTAGTKFNLYFKKIEEQDPQKPAPGIMPPTGDEHIVYLEDDPFMLNLGTEMLQQLGYRVKPVSEGIEAIAYLKEKGEQVDLLITDLLMPAGMDGIEFVRRMRRQGWEKPAIICTSYSETINREQIKNLDIKEVVKKPLTAHKLARVVREVLDANSSAKR